MASVSNSMNYETSVGCMKLAEIENMKVAEVAMQINKSFEEFFEVKLNQYFFYEYLPVCP